MKYIVHFVYVVCLFAASSCAVYTRSNVDIKENKKLASELNFDEYKDVNDGYTSFMVSTPFLVFHQQFTPIETFIPIGPEVFVSTRRLGDLEARAYYMSEGFRYKGDAEYPTFYSDKIRLEYRLIYAYPLWRLTRTIDRYQMNIGADKNFFYYGIFPTDVDIELSLRGGIDYNMNSFVSNRIEQYLREKQSDLLFLGYSYANNVAFRTFNTSIKLGVIFQRKIATRFKTTIRGKSFYPTSYLTEGFYADLSFLVSGDTYTKDIRYSYPSGNGTNTNVTVPISTDVLFKKQLVGFAVGYKRFISGREKGLPWRVLAEIGTQAGRFPDFKSSFYVNIGVGVGLGKRK